MKTCWVLLNNKREVVGISSEVYPFPDETRELMNAGIYTIEKMEWNKAHKEHMEFMGKKMEKNK